MENQEDKYIIRYHTDGKSPRVEEFTNPRRAGHELATVVSGVWVEQAPRQSDTEEMASRLRAYIQYNQHLYVAKNGTVHKSAGESEYIKVSEQLFAHPSQVDYAKQLLWLNQNHTNGYLQALRRHKAVKTSPKPKTNRVVVVATLAMVILIAVVLAYLIFFSGWTPPA